jgi:hypothetical protein
MPRGRATLTEKQERILIQAQLMGLTPQDMQRISNRLIALQKEADEIKRVGEDTLGYIWEDKINSQNLKITTPDGYIVEARRGKKSSNHWNRYSWSYDITVNKPGTRFKTRLYKNADLACDYNWTKRLMPAQSKELYSLIRWTRNSMPYASHE